jgi:DNA-binding transcriptional LysR family regulator
MKAKNGGNARLDLNQVFQFVEVVRASSFAEAARRLRMPANSLSRKIQRLEADLGTRLIHRSTRKLALTTAGQAFFDRCASSVADLARAGQESIDGNRMPGGLVRVAAPADFFDLFRLEWIAEFLATHPRLRMEFILDDAKADLIAASIDLAVRAGHLVDSNHRGHKLIGTHFGFVASPSYLAARGTPTSLRSLTAHDCLPVSNRSGPVIWNLQSSDGSSTIEVSGRFRANTARVVLRAAVAGLGIALLPELLTAPEVGAGRLIQVLPGYRREGADLYAVCASRRQVPRAVSAFIEFVAGRIQSVLTAAPASKSSQPARPPLRSPGRRGAVDG